ncbi:hypothetical protein Cni_G04304 [Canna indica]|uniref:VQ domain-containing protein n=1 Tax=Canna indica TaxID=4628 RepID=A0AAQ3JV63_9LILI|nr:hypothetical protein Cni_G04304 [Canna indica]
MLNRRPPQMSHAEEGRGSASPPLRIIRMPLSKPWRRPAPPPPRVFQVHPRDFRQLVQSLTGAPRPSAAAETMEAAASPPSLLELSWTPQVLPQPPPTAVDSASPVYSDQAAIAGNGSSAATAIQNAVGGDGVELFRPSHTTVDSSTWSCSPIWSFDESDNGGLPFS